MQWSRLVLLLFLTAQVADGIFTYAAVHAFGIEVEGNQLLGTWMWIAGPVPTLIVAKSLAAASGILLYAYGFRQVLAGLTALYWLAAVGPWTIVFHNVS